VRIVLVNGVRVIDHRAKPPKKSRKLPAADKYIRRMARWRARDAARAGKIVRPPFCEHGKGECRGPLEAHHYLGYARENWLRVEWLCRYHHGLADSRTGTEGTTPKGNEMTTDTHSQVSVSGIGVV
jgi:hypothetical protein